MTVEQWHGTALLWPETPEDHAAILAHLGPGSDEVRQVTNAKAAEIMRDVLRRLRARPPPGSETTSRQPNPQRLGSSLRPTLAATTWP